MCAGLRLVNKGIIIEHINNYRITRLYPPGGTEKKVPLMPLDNNGGDDVTSRAGASCFLLS